MGCFHRLFVSHYRNLKRRPAPDRYGVQRDRLCLPVAPTAHLWQRTGDTRLVVIHCHDENEGVPDEQEGEQGNDEHLALFLWQQVCIFVKVADDFQSTIRLYCPNDLYASYCMKAATQHCNGIDNVLFYRIVLILDRRRPNLPPYNIPLVNLLVMAVCKTGELHQIVVNAFAVW